MMFPALPLLIAFLLRRAPTHAAERYGATTDRLSPRSFGPLVETHSARFRSPPLLKVSLTP